MTNTVEKTSLIMSYHFGKDSHDNAKIVTQKFSSVKALSDNAKVKAIGDALAVLIESPHIEVHKEDVISL